MLNINRNLLWRSTVLQRRCGNSVHVTCQSWPETVYLWVVLRMRYMSRISTRSNKMRAFRLIVNTVKCVTRNQGWFTVSQTFRCEFPEIFSGEWIWIYWNISGKKKNFARYTQSFENFSLKISVLLNFSPGYSRLIFWVEWLAFRKVNSFFFLNFPETEYFGTFAPASKLPESLFKWQAPKFVSNMIDIWQVKRHWIGDDYKKEGTAGNDVHKTNVPDIRVAFRHETLVEELSTICTAARVWITL